MWLAGASYSSIVGYVLGYPFLNDTILNETMLLPRQWYDYDDMNISDFMMYMFTSFAKYGWVPLSCVLLIDFVLQTVSFCQLKFNSMTLQARN